MMKFALTCFKDQLKLESEAILEGKVEIRDIPRGFRIMEEDSLKDAALVLVIDGCFSVCQKNEEGREQELHQCYAGGLLGQLQVTLSEWNHHDLSKLTSRLVVTCLLSSDTGLL